MTLIPPPLRAPPSVPKPVEAASAPSPIRPAAPPKPQALRSDAVRPAAPPLRRLSTRVPPVPRVPALARPAHPFIAAGEGDLGALRAALRCDNAGYVCRVTGDTLMHVIARSFEQPQEAIALARAHGAPVDALNSQGMTPLLEAIACCDNAAAVTTLLTCGADPARHTPEGLSALALASRLGKTQSLEALLAADARHPKRMMERPEALKRGLLAASQATQEAVVERLSRVQNPWDAARTGDAVALRQHAQDGTLNVHATLKNGDTLVHVLAQSSDFEPQALACLAQQGADLSVANLEGLTPLHVAILACATEADARRLAQLVEAGADASRCNLRGENPLAFARRRRKAHAVAVLRPLLPEVPAADNAEVRALWLAIRRGSVDTVTAALRGHCDVTAKNGDGDGVLHVAGDNAAMIRVLVRAGAPVNQVDVNESTPLHTVLRYGRTPLGSVRALFDCDIKPNLTHVNLAGYTPLLYAARHAPNAYDVIRFLRKHGAPLDDRKCVGESDADDAPLGSTVVHLLARYNKDPVPSIEDLVRHGAPIDAVDAHGQTALMHLLSSNPVPSADRLAIARKLLALGAKMSVRDNAGKSAEDYAVDLGLRDELVERGHFWRLRREPKPDESSLGVLMHVLDLLDHPTDEAALRSRLHAFARSTHHPIAALLQQLERSKFRPGARPRKVDAVLKKAHASTAQTLFYDGLFDYVSGRYREAARAFSACIRRRDVDGMRVLPYMTFYDGLAALHCEDASQAVASLLQTKAVVSASTAQTGPAYAKVLFHLAGALEQDGALVDAALAFEELNALELEGRGLGTYTYDYKLIPWVTVCTSTAQDRRQRCNELTERAAQVQQEIAGLHTLLRATPDNGDFLMALGGAQWHVFGKRKRAVDNFQRAVESFAAQAQGPHFPSRAYELLRYAETLVDLGLVEEARRCYRAAGDTLGASSFARRAGHTDAVCATDFLDFATVLHASGAMDVAADVFARGSQIILDAADGGHSVADRVALQMQWGDAGRRLGVAEAAENHFNATARLVSPRVRACSMPGTYPSQDAGDADFDFCWDVLMQLVERNARCAMQTLLSAWAEVARDQPTILRQLAELCQAVNASGVAEPLWECLLHQAPQDANLHEEYIRSLIANHNTMAAAAATQAAIARFPAQKQRFFQLCAPAGKLLEASVRWPGDPSPTLPAFSADTGRGAPLAVLPGSPSRDR
jgi:ankyrin repeat protein/tetratricopeptide (TPR) repeat protein